VLIRRDNVEHLIMIGGPNDVVIESQIIRALISQGVPVPAGATAPRQQQAVQRAPQAPLPPPAPAAPIPAPAPLSPPEPDVRPQAPAAAATPQAPSPQVPAPQVSAPRPPEPRAPQPAFGDPARTTNFYRAIMNREPGRPGETPLPASERAAAERTAAERRPAEPSPEPVRPTAPAAPAAPARGDVDPLFADIERKLDEALKRPAPSFGRSEPQRTEQPRPEAPARAPQHPAADTASGPRPAQPTPASASGGEASKSALDALEEEMASLLGRGFDRDER
jgi:hypothetical protein